MTKEELVEKAQSFKLPESELKERHDSCAEFLDVFPINKLGLLTPTEYCGVGNRDSFVYWIEHRVKGFGVGGGNASKFGIYQGKDRAFYTGTKNKKRRLEGEELATQLSGLLQKIVESCALARDGRTEAIKDLDIPMWPMILIKILSLYVPSRFLKVGKKEVIEACARDLGLKTALAEKDLVNLNAQCRKALGEFPSSQAWDDEDFGAFVWRQYPSEATRVGSVADVEELDESSRLIEHFPLNTILFGPPGTGKTFNTIDRAVEIVDGTSNDHLVNKRRFDELREAGQVQFVTFHQNYAYEDFMVGIRPETSGGQLTFEDKTGIFYDIAIEARNNFVAAKSKQKRRTFDEVFDEILLPLIERGEEVEIPMAQSSFWLTEVTDKLLRFRKSRGDSDHTLNISTLRDWVSGTREIRGGLRHYYGPLVELIRSKQETGEPAEPEKRYVLIIDEINRANISRVFGELITLLEPDKRLGAANEIRVTLPNGERDFVLPPNLFLIGTMNTADKSIALVDIALRRRFEFVGLYPIPDIVPDPYAAQLLRQLNKKIFEKKHSADYLIGHAYFMSDAPTDAVIRHKVIPLLTEYFSGKNEIVEEIFRDTAWSVNYNTETFEWDISEA